MWEYSPQNCQNFKFWPWICPSGVTLLPNFNEFCTSLQVNFKFLLWSLSGYKQPSYKHFPSNFQLPPVAKILIGSKKLGGAKTGQTSSITMPSMVGSRADCRWRSVMYFLFVFLSRFGITKFVIMETPWSSEIFKTIMAPLHRGRFLVVYLHSNFSMDLLDFFLGANCYFGSHKATNMKWVSV